MADKIARKKVMPISTGRPKGALNKTTALLKDAILQAAEQAGADGSGRDGLVGYLKARAVDVPGPFMNLLGKVLPMQVVGDPNAPLHIAVSRIERVIIDAKAPDRDSEGLCPAVEAGSL